MAVVALSIEPFAAGPKLPARMAQQLGLAYFDLAPFERGVAERMALHRRDSIVGCNPDGTDQRWTMTISDFAARMRELALEAALHGNVLIHGWTAVSMLGGLSHVATAWLQGSAHFRSLEVQKHRKYPLLECAALDLAGEDALVARFVAHVLEEAWCPFPPADLIIDMERISERGCMTLVAALAAEPRCAQSSQAEIEINERLLELR